MYENHAKYHQKELIWPYLISSFYLKCPSMLDTCLGMMNDFIHFIFFAREVFSI